MAKLEKLTNQNPDWLEARFHRVTDNEKETLKLQAMFVVFARYNNSGFSSLSEYFKINQYKSELLDSASIIDDELDLLQKNIFLL